MKVVSPSWKKALFLVGIMPLMNVAIQTLKSASAIYWVLSIVAIIVWVILAKKVYLTTVGKAIGLWIINFIALLIAIGVVGVITTVALTSLSAAKQKALEQEMPAQSQTSSQNSVPDQTSTSTQGQTTDIRTQNIQTGIADIKAGQFAPAIVVLTLNTDADTNDAESYVLLGAAKVESGDVAGGTVDLNHALANKNDNLNDHSAYYYLGVVQNDPTTKISDFTKALNSPQNPANSLEIPDKELYYKLAVTNLQIKNLSAALTNITAVVNIDPNYQSALIFKALIEAQMGNMQAACTDATNGKDTSDPQAQVTQLKAQIMSEACK